MKKEYKNFGFRLNDKTLELLTMVKNESGKSWNLFFYKLIVGHINNNKARYRKYFIEDYQKHKKDKCEFCGEPNGYKKLCVHHLDADVTNNKKENLQTLCRRCHGKKWEKKVCH